MTATDAALLERWMGMTEQGRWEAYRALAAALPAPQQSPLAAWDRVDVTTANSAASPAPLDPDACPCYVHHPEKYGLASPAPLDVERLARALLATDVAFVYSNETAREHAAAIARAYAEEEGS